MAKISIITLGLAVSLAAGLPALAQSSTGSANYNAGYGRTAGQENRMVDYSTRDANGNRVIVDGVMLTGEDQSTFTRAGGSLDSYSGAGSLGGNSTAIGNNLVVITQGSYNVVIVDSTQTNNGDVTANAGDGDDD
ncbi:MAG: endonuclease [Caulobacteraceae bacterium]|nr:holdfast anchoring protein HfaA [Caulobacter sp.]RYG19284.1 MAG: endonuclease [Caulobacteraceae bacterium]